MGKSIKINEIVRTYLQEVEIRNGLKDNIYRSFIQEVGEYTKLGYLPESIDENNLDIKMVEEALDNLLVAVIDESMSGIKKSIKLKRRIERNKNSLKGIVTRKRYKRPKTVYKVYEDIIEYMLVYKSWEDNNGIEPLDMIQVLMEMEKYIYVEIPEYKRRYTIGVYEGLKIRELIELIGEQEFYSSQTIVKGLKEEVVYSNQNWVEFDVNIPIGSRNYSIRTSSTIKREYMENILNIISDDFYKHDEIKLYVETYMAQRSEEIQSEVNQAVQKLRVETLVPYSYEYIQQGLMNRRVLHHVDEEILLEGIYTYIGNRYLYKYKNNFEKDVTQDSFNLINNIKYEWSDDLKMYLRMILRAIELTDTQHIENYQYIFNLMLRSFKGNNDREKARSMIKYLSVKGISIETTFNNIYYGDIGIWITYPTPFKNTEEMSMDYIERNVIGNVRDVYVNLYGVYFIEEGEIIHVEGLRKEMDSRYISKNGVLKGLFNKLVTTTE